MLTALITIFSTSFMIALSGALMPGPVLTVTVSESTRRGALAGPLMMLGHGILELALIMALFAGLAPFLSQDKVFITVSFVGGDNIDVDGNRHASSVIDYKTDHGGLVGNNPVIWYWPESCSAWQTHTG